MAKTMKVHISDMYYNFAYCITGIAFWYSILVLHSGIVFYIVFWYCILVLYFGIAFWYCILVLHSGIVFWYRILVLYFSIAFWFCILYCILVLHSGIVFWYRILVLYFSIAFWFCGITECYACCSMYTCTRCTVHSLSHRIITSYHITPTQMHSDMLLTCIDYVYRKSVKVMMTP